MSGIEEHPALGRDYLILRDGECVGRATYVDDKHHGPCYRGEAGGEHVIYMDVDEAIPVNDTDP